MVVEIVDQDGGSDAKAAVRSGVVEDAGEGAVGGSNAARDSNADSTIANDRNGDVAVDTVRRKRFAKGDCGGVACVDATHEHESFGHEAEVVSALRAVKNM